MKAVSSLSIAIVSWDGREHLETCLEALSDQRDPGVPVQTLVFDNGSRDGTAEWLARRYPEVELVRSESNLGFCVANNRLAQRASGDAIAFLNNDTRPAPDWLRSLLQTLRDSPPDVAGVSGYSVSWDATRLDFARGVMLFDGHAFQNGLGLPIRDARLPEEGTELQFPHGGNMLLRRDVFLELGGLDESFFAYFDDVDLGWRTWSAGYRIVASPAQVRHRSMGTGWRLGEVNRSFLYTRNSLRTAYKNYDAEMWARLMPVVLLTFMARTARMLSENNPGGGSMKLDPYQGIIADTAPSPDSESAKGRMRRLLSHGRSWSTGALLYRLGEWLQTRGLRAMGHAAADPPPVLSDVYSLARLRALSSLLVNLDEDAGRRESIQSRRRRSDREIFERFPLYLVPMLPGDEELFETSGFKSWLPGDPALVRKKREDFESKA